MCGLWGAPAGAKSSAPAVSPQAANTSCKLSVKQIHILMHTPEPGKQPQVCKTPTGSGTASAAAAQGSMRCDHKPQQPLQRPRLRPHGGTTPAPDAAKVTRSDSSYIATLPAAVHAADVTSEPIEAVEGLSLSRTSHTASPSAARCSCAADSPLSSSRATRLLQLP